MTNRSLTQTVLEGLAFRWQVLLRLPALVHREERGTIGIVSLFGLLLLVILLGMVMNAGRQVDQKIKMQNAADAATQSGGVVLTRSMNTLAFTNHLLCDVFALTAYMREARDRQAESLTPQILDDWALVGPFMATSEYPPFAELGQAITEKNVPERELVRTFGEWAAAASEMMLPVLEDILANHRIPEFQRALVQTTPGLAQAAMQEVAERHGAAWPRPARLSGALWRTSVNVVGGAAEAERRTLPVVDPELDAVPEQELYINDARRQRASLAHTYLEHWNNESLQVFDIDGKMSQFSNLWRIRTCGHLNRLLDEEYPRTNLLFQIRTPVNRIDRLNAHLEQDFMFVGVVYRDKLPDLIPGIFRNPVGADTQAYAQISMYVPRRRLIWVQRDGGVFDRPQSSGGVPGQTVELPTRGGGAPVVIPPAERVVGRQSPGPHPDRWDLITQNWSMQLVPATAASLPMILSTPPSIYSATSIETPNLGELGPEDIPWISHH
jgi:hypothetical protein